MQARHEQPTFETGDRFRLRLPIVAMDFTREDEGEEATFWDHFAAGLKGTITEIEVWENDPEGCDNTLEFTLCFDAFPHRTILYLAYDEHGGPFEKVAAKAVSLN